jgi:hypothetical protein
MRGVGEGSIPPNPDDDLAGFKEFHLVPVFSRKGKVANIEIRPA